MKRDSLKFEKLREEMVKKQIQSRGISDPQVLRAMRCVPRHLFVSEALMDQAYGDHPLPIGRATDHFTAFYCCGDDPGTGFE